MPGRAANHGTEHGCAKPLYRFGVGDPRSQDVVATQQIDIRYVCCIVDVCQSLRVERDRAVRTAGQAALMLPTYTTHQVCTYVEVVRRPAMTRQNLYTSRLEHHTYTWRLTLKGAYVCLYLRSFCPGSM